jgi:hypothetical protein
MAKLNSGRVIRTPQSGITSDRYQFLGLEQAEPNLGDPQIGPSSVGANPIPVGTPYQLIAVDGAEGERFWAQGVGIGTTLGYISVYDNGFLPNNKFNAIHGINFVGGGVTVQVPPLLGPTAGVGIATVIIAIDELLNQGDVGQVIVNTSTGFATGNTNIYWDYANTNLGINTDQPTSDLYVKGTGEFSGIVTAPFFYGNLVGIATTALNLENAGNITTGFISSERFQPNGYFPIKVATALTAGNTGSALTAVNVIGGIGSITNLVVSGISSIVGFGSTVGLILEGYLSYDAEDVANGTFNSIGTTGTVLMSTFDPVTRTGYGISWVDVKDAALYGIQGIQGIQGTQGTDGIQGIQGITGIQGRQGIQGIQGIQGVQGTQGVDGVLGSQGVQGIQGINGIQGTQGTTGIQGVQGTTGIQGVQGTQGIQGIQGISGGVGTKGVQGIQGIQGTGGVQGRQGIQGIQGIAGGTGTKGVQGIQGIQGVQGTQGTDGIQGIQGVQGTRGVQGRQGIQGIQGISGGAGTNGIQGIQGIQGVQGTQGTDGIQGVQGTDGVQGVQGIQGVQGTRGVQGIQGVRGVQGRQGIQGIQGVQGTQGTDGIQGVQGTQGTDGIQGATGAGVQGAQGTDGIQGRQGIQGIQGIQGRQGTFGPATIPANSTGTNPYTIIATDNGKHILTNGNDITVPNTNFGAGDNCVIFNNSTNTIDITAASGALLRFGGSTQTGSRFLAPYGVATLLCYNVSGVSPFRSYVITGAGLV